MIRLVVTLMACLLASGQAALAQKQKKPNSALGKAGLEDPFTEQDPKRMEALGVVGYGPLTWADNLRTTDIEKVLGEGRVLWMETEHFKIGCNLGYCGAPKDTTARRMLKGEMKRLNKKCRKIPASRSKLDPWLRMHLYAQRADELYDEFATMAGIEDAPEGQPQKHLGRDQKFLLLLFEKRSDLVRFFDRFCGRKTQNSQRNQHVSGHLAMVLTAEGDDGPRDCETVHAQFRFFLMQMFVDAAGGGPPWLSYGLGHWYERQVPCNLINCGVRADESVDPATQYDWPRKVQKRVKHEALVLPFTKMCRTADLGYYGHVQAWSRVDWLMQDREKCGRFLHLVLGNTSRSRQIAALAEVYELGPEEWDAEWRKWATKFYK